jgi:hypothetical protein
MPDLTELPPDWELPRGYRVRLLATRAAARARREPRAMLVIVVVLAVLASTYLAVTATGGPGAACRRADAGQQAGRYHPACVPALPPGPHMGP